MCQKPVASTFSRTELRNLHFRWTYSALQKETNVTRMFRLMTIAALLVFAPAGIRAQDNPGAGGPQPAPQGASRAPAAALVPLKVTLVISRYQGDKKLSSLPYTLMITANDRQSARLRLGTQLPVVSTVFGAASAGKEGNVPMSSYNYKDVGTNIDCEASTAGDGAFKLALTIADTSVYYPDRTETAVTSSITATGAPAFRSFNSTFNILLRDGQTSQYIAATDPVSGQTLRLDATVNVQK